MADQKFSCPHCQQHLEAGADYAGLQINCPACNGSLTVPGPAAPAAPPPMPSRPAAATGQGCPSCGTPLARGAVLCTKCGYNLATGKRIVAGKVVPPGKPQPDNWETPWYKTAYPYVGFVVVLLGVLYFFSRSNPDLQPVLVGLAALYVLTSHIIVTVAAFRDGVGTGFLTLCIPFYAIYYVYWVAESDMLKVIYGVAIITNIALRFVE
ncbi:MAG TPA: hypothetical protein VL527_13315 [Dongiaceae bacterium]|jgi:hypothetical protein|nr:hypothetical protein [Dongiaceae bacterium]